MANNIEIVIEDKVDSSISTKLKDIGEQAKSAHSYISLLKGELSKLGSFSISSLQAQMRNVSSELDKIRAKLKAGDYKAVINIETRQSNLKQGDYVSQIAAENRVLEGQQKILAGNAAEENRNAQAKERLLNKVYPLRQAHMAYNAAIAESNRLLQQGVISTQAHAAAQEHALATLQRTKLAQTQWNESLLKTNKTSELSRMHMVNLGYQLNDIGVSLASGQNPMVVFIQQGSQIAGIAAAAGVSMGQMAKSAVALIAPFLPLTAAVGTAIGAFFLFRSEMNKQESMKEYVKTLGLTTSEMKRLKDVTITTGDTFKGFFRVLEERFGTSSLAKKIAGGFIFAFKQMLEFTKGVFIMIYALGKATYTSLLSIWNNFPTMFGNFFINAANIAIKSLNSITDASADLVNAFIRSLNSLPKGLLGIELIPEFDKKQIGLLQNKYEGAVSNIGDVFANSIIDGVKEGEKETNRFMNDWKKASTEIAKDRLKKQADEILEGKTSSADKAAEKRASTLAKINAELDNELERMFMLKPEREMQARYDQIEEKLIGKKIKLTQQESDAIKEKIKIIRSATIAQQKYDQLYDEIQGPLESYNGLIEAGDELFKRRVISQEKFEAIFANAAEQYKQASDPLYSYNKSINEQTKLLGFNSKEREIQSKLIDAENDLRSKNTPNLEKELELLGEQYRTLQQLTSIRAAYDTIYSSTKGKQEDLRNAIEGTNQAFRDGLLSSEQYTIELNSIGNEFIETKMILGDASWADVQTSALYQMISNFKGGVIEIRDIFGNMFTQIEDGFANSIGKAAIYGNDLKTSFYELSREILSGLISSLVKLGIQWVMNATLADSLAAASAATQTAMSLATASAISAAYATPAALVSLASFGANAGPAMAGISATTSLARSMAMVSGFKQGGYTGDGPVDQVAGPVHRKEFVFDAKATRRLGVGNLEALRAGAAQLSSNSSVGKQGAVRIGSGFSVNIENYGTSKEFEVQQIGESDVRIIARDEARQVIRKETPTIVAGEIRNPNSSVSKSLTQSTQIQRRR